MKTLFRSALLLFPLILLSACKGDVKVETDRPDTVYVDRPVEDGGATPGDNATDGSATDDDKKDEKDGKGSSEEEKDKSGSKVERIRFRAGTTGGEVKGKITGYDVREYLLGAKGGQTLSANLHSDNQFAFMTLRHVKSDELLYDGSSEGMKTMMVELPNDGDYRIEVLLPRSEARRDGVANFTLDVTIE